MLEVTKILVYIYGITLARYIFIAGIAYFIFYTIFKNWLKNSKIQSRSVRKKDLRREIVHSALSCAIFAIISIILISDPVKKTTLIYERADDYPYWWMGISVIVALVIHDTYFYWMHRLLHTKPLYRTAHQLHHRSNNPSPWSCYSFHIIEAFFESVILILLVYIMPMHIISISLFTVVGLLINVYGHLGYEIAPRGFRKTVFFKLFNTSVHHNMHHSRFSGNYGLYFRHWDRLMGTEIIDYENEYDKIQAKRFDTN